MTIDTITLADDGSRWAQLGFRMIEENCQLGSVMLGFSGRTEAAGVLGWSLRGLSTTNLDGLPTSASDQTARAKADTHPNGVSAIDHIVAISPNLDRSVAALQAAGLDLRRIREQPTPAGAPRQAFFRLGREILEVIQEPEEAVRRLGEDRDLRFWGLALAVGDLKRTVAGLGKNVGEIRPAVQPSRQIATLHRAAGLAIPIALISASAGDGREAAV